MRTIAFTILLLLVVALQAQEEITFKDPLKIIAKEKVSSEIKSGEMLYVNGLSYSYNNGNSLISITSQKPDGSKIIFEAKKINSFEFVEIDNVKNVWEKSLLTCGTYSNLLTKGNQYNIRNELNNDAVDYINALSEADYFFNDGYFEDYIYTLLNKIHASTLGDERPGNLFVKIVKETYPNAYSLPNGCIIISTGLLSTIQSEDELVGILAHEVAHFVLDHQILNYNEEIDRKKRAAFWADFATVAAASVEVYLSVNNKNYIPGMLTASTAKAASDISEEIITRLGIKYTQEQEYEADKVAQEILSVLKYNKMGLAAALQRITDYSVITGNYLALSASGTHPGLYSRISLFGPPINIGSFSNPAFLKKVSLINSYNSWIELWYFAHHLAANELVDRNIKNGVATESDYIVKAIVTRRLSNTKESNEEVISLLKKAKSINVTPYIIISKEEGITYLRMNEKVEAEKSFQIYLTMLNDVKSENESKGLMENRVIEDEITWVKKMIFKVGNL